MIHVKQEPTERNCVAVALAALSERSVEDVTQYYQSTFNLSGLYRAIVHLGFRLRYDVMYVAQVRYPEHGERVCPNGDLVPVTHIVAIDNRGMVYDGHLDAPLPMYEYFSMDPRPVLWNLIPVEKREQ